MPVRSAHAPHRWGPAQKALIAVVAMGSLSLGTAGVAGATGGSAAGSGAPQGKSVHCTGVEHRLADLRHRQAELSGKVARLQTASALAAKAGRSHRAATAHRNLVHWQKIQAHRINARFLRREAKLAALAAAHCSAATVTPTTLPAGTAA